MKKKYEKKSVWCIAACFIFANIWTLFGVWISHTSHCPDLKCISEEMEIQINLGKLCLAAILLVGALSIYYTSLAFKKR